MTEIKPTQSNVVYQNCWMTVREDEIVRSDGSKGLYGVVDKADFAVIVARNKEQIFLVEQFRYPVQGRFWEFPQGSWEDRKTKSPVELAKAGLREETGLVTKNVVWVGNLFLAYGYSNQGYDLFLATELEQQETELEPEEQGLVAKAFDISLVESMIKDGTIKDATTVAAFGLLRIKGLL